MEQNYLYHWGVKGMKWGVRKKRQSRHEDYTKAHDRKSVKYMSDAELKSRNNRLQAEKQYRELTKKSGRGKKAIGAFVSTAGTITAVAGAYATYKGLANGALDKIGDWVINSINLKGPLH